jgi:hypothetical protein
MIPGLKRLDGRYLFIRFVSMVLVNIPGCCERVGVSYQLWLRSDSDFFLKLSVLLTYLLHQV